MTHLHRYATGWAILLIGCAPADSRDPEADRAAVRAVIEQEVRAANAGDPDDFVAAFSDDAVAIPPGMRAVKGDEFRQWIRGFFDGFEVRLASYEDDQLILAGDHAIHHYSFNWTITPKAGGEPFVERGQGIHILRRDEGGAWRITHDIWNGDSPAEGM